MRKTLISTLLLICAPVWASSTAQDWAKITRPSPVAVGGKSIGTFTSGCLRGAESLPLQGPGYQVMRLSRKRYYGHPDLIRFIQQLGQVSATQGLGTLLIGDLGQPRGGPTLSGHRSHQTGLDVDIWFLLSPQADSRLLTSIERETWNAPSVLEANGKQLDRHQWSLAQAKILQAAALQPGVDRIFVNARIKQDLCASQTGDSAWLRKIRPWWKHDDHFHVRMQCPPDSPLCEKQEALPPGNGCDASLAWWFSAEAQAPSSTAPQPPPPLPAVCEQVLRE